jgi:hypothetical protein
MEYPENVLEVVKKAANRYPRDINKACNVAEKGVRNLPDFDNFSGVLIHNAVRELVGDFRHTMNRQIKNAAGVYGQKPKVVSGSSKSVQRAYESVYEYRIAGTVLGDVLGEELGDILDGERARADGHLFNVRICSRLIDKVPSKKRVRDAVQERTLQKIFNDEDSDGKGFAKAGC